MSEASIGFATGSTFTSLDRWRQLIDDEKTGAALAAALGRLSRGRKLDVVGQALKRVPAPFDATHPRADLMRHKALQARWRDENVRRRRARQCGECACRDQRMAGAAGRRVREKGKATGFSPRDIEERELCPSMGVARLRPPAVLTIRQLSHDQKLNPGVAVGAGHHLRQLDADGGGTQHGQSATGAQRDDETQPGNRATKRTEQMLTLWGGGRLPRG